MENAKLKPCPFCGGMAFIERTNVNQYYVKCFHRTNCYLTGRAPRKYNVRDVLIKIWNRRNDNNEWLN